MYYTMRFACFVALSVKCDSNDIVVSATAAGEGRDAANAPALQVRGRGVDGRRCRI